MDKVRDLSDIANAILDAGWSVTPKDALYIAVQVQLNETLRDIFLLDNPQGQPSALEAIAMALAGKTI
jgi:hypothetical protein